MVTGDNKAKDSRRGSAEKKTEKKKARKIKVTLVLAGLPESVNPQL